MSIDLLFADFDRLIQSSESVHRLRRFILDLAVRGKLAPQDPNDEPASELLKRIAAEKARLVKAGKLITKVPIPSGKPVEQDFLTPTTWTTAKLADISNIVMGQSPPGETYNTYGEGVPLINGPVEFSEGPFGTTVLNQYTTAPTNFCQKGDFLICVRGSTTGRSNIAGFGACIGRGVAAIQSLFDDDFVRFFLWSMRERIIGMGRGAAFPSITRKQLENLPVPLPPLAEQHRIVAKVDELMALCDRLEAARAEREATRDRLATASLARLNAPDPNPARFQHDVAFALNNLTSLTTRPDQIKALRQTMLNLAIHGKLVPQDPNDEPASELLKRTAAKKVRLVAEGKIRKQKKLLPVHRDEVLVEDIPGWIWVRLGEVSTKITKGSTPTSYGHAYTKEGVNFVKVESIKVGSLLPENITSFIANETHGFMARSQLAAGDILFSIAGSIGTCAVVTNRVLPANTNQALAIIRGTQTAFLAEFLLKLLQSSVAQSVVTKARGGAMNNISLGDIQNSVVPVPPLAEQHRIVAKIDELMRLCDQLETSLKIGDRTGHNLLAALLHAALEQNRDL